MLSGCCCTLNTLQSGVNSFHMRWETQTHKGSLHGDARFIAVAWNQAQYLCSVADTYLFTLQKKSERHQPKQTRVYTSHYFPMTFSENTKTAYFVIWPFRNCVPSPQARSGLPVPGPTCLQ